MAETSFAPSVDSHAFAGTFVLTHQYSHLQRIASLMPLQFVAGAAAT
jgi:hypothetical protein